ncbi:MFS transporter [Planctomonas psychrotolerans]|uniref:MFS transporter n=1 Tax=Planctomonas psychrotolerans TaxID=2528712 RepID=UPI00123B7C67|nr:MFS transporter [Planctomonas psychrotolerans]
MIARRAFFYWQFVAALLLPLWVLVGRGLFGATVGWQFVLLVILAPILAISMLMVAGMISARKDVRSTRAVSWLDVAAVGVWHLCILALGFFVVDVGASGEGGTSAFTQVAGSDSEGLSTVLANLFGALTVIVGVAAFWIAVWQFLRETRKRVRTVMETLERDASGAAPGSGPALWKGPDGRGTARVIRLDPTDSPKRDER